MRDRRNRSHSGRRLARPSWRTRCSTCPALSATPSRTSRRWLQALGRGDRQHRDDGADARLDHRPVRPVSPVAGRRCHRHRPLSDRRDLGAAAGRPLRRPDRGRQGPGADPLPVDHRIADRERQAGRPADLHRRAGALLPQGPAGKVRRRRSEDLGRADRGRADDPGRRARRRQGRLLGLRLAGQRL